MKLDLEEYRSGESIIFSGRKRGKAVRKAAGLDKKEPRFEKITVIVPEDVINVTSSFVLGLLGTTYRQLGESKARSHVVFKGPINDEAIDDAISEALRGDSFE
jgi:hypothetical protein